MTFEPSSMLDVTWERIIVGIFAVYELLALGLGRISGLLRWLGGCGSLAVKHKLSNSHSLDHRVRF